METEAGMQRIALAPDYEISRVIRGGWQMANGHGTLVSDDPVADMVAFADAGITTFDCADIYTGVEELIGRFRTRYRELRGDHALARVKVHTKCVPDLAILPHVAKADIERIVDQSLRRLRMERLDLVQFHWWDYESDRWLQTALWLNELQRAGKIHKIGGTNFDTDRMLGMIEAGVPLASMQVQYSLLDRRPEKRMVRACADHGVAIFCYGTNAGGFLGERWLGAAEPNHDLENRSLVKYKLIIDDLGGWDFFQALLATLRQLAERHGADIATIASAAMLARPGVAAVIVGARNRSHLGANAAIASIRLTHQDERDLAAILSEANALDGDVYALERDRAGRHGSIMKYNLNKQAS